MADAQWEMLLSPPSTYCVEIASANTASLDLNINIIIAKRFWLKLIEVELSPVLWVLNLKALESIWINHCAGLSFLGKGTTVKTLVKKREMDEEDKQGQTELKRKLIITLPTAVTKEKQSTVQGCESKTTPPRLAGFVTSVDSHSDYYPDREAFQKKSSGDAPHLLRLPARFSTKQIMSPLGMKRDKDCGGEMQGMA